VADAADSTKDPELLTEHARRALTNTIARIHMDETGVVRGITIGPKLEVSLLGLFSPRPNQNPSALLTPDSLGALLRDLDNMATTLATDGRPVPLLTPPSLRVGVRRLVEPVLPNLPVVSLAELPPFVRLSSVATWDVARG
jgi:flagellar biosynthesis protein FlhA